MKKIISLFLTIFIVSITYIYRTDIKEYIVNNYIYKKTIEVPDSNEYKKNTEFIYFKNTDNFYPNNKKELYNVFYTIINSGFDSFTFYCGDEYKTCEKDIREISSNNNPILSIINNYVHPYNSYKTINININNLGRINIEVEKLYTKRDIAILDNSIDTIYNKLITPNMTDEQKIKTIHDYIVNTTVYDKSWKSAQLNRKYKSNTAYGPLLQHIALCGGYTDAMALFLEKINIPNYRISSDNHIWNFLYINNSWKHLDLTWDDPVTNTGKNILQYDYYLINTITLENKKDNEHKYEKEYYVEAK